MNVYAEKEISVTVTYKNLLIYKSVYELFKSLYNFCKMLKFKTHLDYCYCNCLPENCHLCKFSDYVINHNIQDDLLYYRSNEQKLLEIVEIYNFYIERIKTEMRRYLIGYDPLQFFKNEYVWKFRKVVMQLDEVIKNDIEIFEDNQKKKFN